VHPGEFDVQSSDGFADSEDITPITVVQFEAVFSLLPLFPGATYGEWAAEPFCTLWFAWLKPQVSEFGYFLFIF